MTRILIMGPPGVGKGTQAARLSRQLGVPAISTGDLFRAHVADGTELGVLLAGIIAAGDYVPDEITNRMVRERLSEPDVAGGFILDGYPRTAEQVEQLDTILASLDVELTGALLLEADAETIVERLSRRAEQQDRADDTPAVIRHRITVYEQETSALSDAYAARGRLSRIDGEGGSDDVTARARAALDSLLEPTDRSGTPVSESGRTQAATGLLEDAAT